MFRKVIAALLIHGLVLQPVQQMLQPLYAAESPVRLASLASDLPEAGQVLEEGAVLPSPIEVEEIADGPAVEFTSAGELGLAVAVAFADSATPSADFPTPWQGAPNVVYIGG